MKLVTGVESSTRFVRRSGREGKAVKRNRRRHTAKTMMEMLRRSMAKSASIGENDSGFAAYNYGCSYGLDQ